MKWLRRIVILILLTLAGRQLTKAETFKAQELKHKKNLKTAKRDHHLDEVRAEEKAESDAREKAKAIAKKAAQRIKQAEERHDAPDDDAALAAYRKRLRGLQSRS